MFYKSVIRPSRSMRVLHGTSSLTVEQSNGNELFQKRALKIIHTDFISGDNAYTYSCTVADLPQVADRREQLTRRLFVKMEDTDNCLNYLLPTKRDSEIISSLRTAKEYPLIRTKSTRFKNHSFHTHCLTINDSLEVTVQQCYSSSLCMFQSSF